MNNISVDKLMDAILSTREPLDFYYENKYPLSFKDQLNYYLWIVYDRMYTYGWKRSFRSGYKEQFDFINGINEKYPEMATNCCLVQLKNNMIRRFIIENKKRLNELKVNTIYHLFIYLLK